jgi:FkbH-like protein
VKIEHATKGQLKRVVELVNRTNQFNLTGARVTQAELEKDLRRTQWVITAAAKDKFGSMGVVGAMAVRKTSEGLEIPAFVLSCRVFGFGIEYALLNAVRELAPKETRVVGLYRETPHNAPCRDFYSKAGFSWDSTRWVGSTSALAGNPSWLQVDAPAPG